MIRQIHQHEKNKNVCFTDKYYTIYSDLWKQIKEINS
jgi:hypothetical protein